MLKVSLVTMLDNEINLGLGYLVAYYRKYGRHKSAIDFKTMECSRSFNRVSESANSISKRLKNSNIVCFPTVTQDYDFILKSAQKIKTLYKIPILFGGYHISCLPHTLPDFVDIGVIGEGEEIFKELLDGYLDHKRFDHYWLKNVRGIVYHEGGEVRINERRELIKELDTIPPPARDIFNKRYWLPRAIGPYDSGEGMKIVDRISTSRGCPFKCVFCASSKFWNNRIRYFSAEYVVSEISSLVSKYHCNSLHINDDLVAGDVERLGRIVRLMRESGLSEKVEFASVQARVDTFDDEVCHLLKEMKVRTVGFGIESGSDTILKYLKNGTVTADQNWEAIKRALKWGFFVWPQLIVGNPGETKEDVEKTLKFTRVKEIPHYQIVMLTPYPGTGLWDYAKKKGLVHEKMDFSRLALDIKKWELKNKIYLGDKLTIEELWQLIKNPFEKEQWLSLSSAKIDLRKRGSNYFKSFLKSPIKSTLWAINRIKGKLV